MPLAFPPCSGDCCWDRDEGDDEAVEAAVSEADLAGAEPASGGVSDAVPSGAGSGLCDRVSDALVSAARMLCFAFSATSSGRSRLSWLAFDRAGTASWPLGFWATIWRPFLALEDKN